MEVIKMSKTLTSGEIYMILALIADKHGTGYSDDPEVRRLQAKLSVLLAVACERERSTGT